MNHSEIGNLVYAIARELGGWQMIHDHNWRDGLFEIFDPQDPDVRLELDVSCSGKLEITGRYIADFHDRHYSEPTHKIVCSLTRTVASIVQDIEKRFLPKYLDVLRDEQRQRTDKEMRVKHCNMLYDRFFGQFVDIDPERGPVTLEGGDLRAVVKVGQYAPVAWYRRDTLILNNVGYDSMSMEFKITCSAQQAERVMRLLMEMKGGEDGA